MTPSPPPVDVRPPRARVAVACVLANLAAIACLATTGRAASAPDEKHALRLRLQAGQAWAFTSSMDSDMTVRASANGQALPDDRTVVGQRRAGTLAVTAVRDGVPTAVTATFAADCADVATVDGKPQSEPWPLAGKTIAFRREADGRVTNDARDLDPALAAEVGQLLEMDQTLYPKDAVAVGDGWTPDAAKLRQQFQLSADDKVDVRCKLIGVVDVRGRRAYDVSLTGTLTKVADGVTERTDLGGSMRYDAATGVPLQGNLTARVTLKGDQPVQGPNGPAVLAVTGGGRVTLTQTTVPQDLAVAAAAAARPPASGPDGRQPLGPQPPGARPLGPVAGGAGLVGRPDVPTIPPERPVGPVRGPVATDPVPGGRGPLVPLPPNASPEQRPAVGRPTPGVAGAGQAASRPPASPFGGLFRGTELSSDFEVEDGRVTGSITKAGKQYPVRGDVRDGRMVGTFEASGAEFNFVATVAGDTMTFETEGSRYVMRKR
jgi:hypothetical protein